MTTVTAPRRTTFHRRGTTVVLVSMLAVAVLVLVAALALPRLMSTPAVTHPVQTVKQTGLDGGYESHHQVRGNARVHAAAAVASARQNLRQLLNQQTRLLDQDTPKGTGPLNALAMKVAAARTGLANALSAQRALQTH